MHRTNVYLTEAQERALDARARATGTTRSGALRAVLDEALATGRGPEHDAVTKDFGDLADRFGALADELFVDDPDLRIER